MIEASQRMLKVNGQRGEGKEEGGINPVMKRHNILRYVPT
jgi:hypothetical protein